MVNYCIFFLVKYFVLFSCAKPWRSFCSLPSCFFNWLLRLAENVTPKDRGRIVDQLDSAEEVLQLLVEYQLVKRCIFAILITRCDKSLKTAAQLFCYLQSIYMKVTHFLNQRTTLWTSEAHIHTTSMFFPFIAWLTF